MGACYLCSFIGDNGSKHDWIKYQTSKRENFFRVKFDKKNNYDVVNIILEYKIPSRSKFHSTITHA